YKYKNSRKKRLFIYTDSRGFEISKIKNRKSPFSSYILYFVKNYNCDVFICPEKHTTIFDFLFTFEKYKKIDYSFVIAHIGVVDFSPRPHSQVKEILELKKKKILYFFSYEKYIELLDSEIYQEDYMGESTASLIPDFFLNEIVNQFYSIRNLVWISCNP